MARIQKAVGIAGAAALVAAAVATPAHALTTQVYNADLGGPPYTSYSGSVTGTLIGNLVILGGGTTTCTSSTLGGTVSSSGPLTLSSASVSGCSGTASSITPQNLPWSGSVTWANSPLRDGTISISGFTMRATVFGVNCTYGGNVVVPVWNGNHSLRPKPANGEAQVDLGGVVINKTAGIFLCPASATIDEGVYALTGTGGTSLGVTGTP